jgi:hypothetical protein
MATNPNINTNTRDDERGMGSRCICVSSARYDLFLFFLLYSLISYRYTTNDNDDRGSRRRCGASPGDFFLF